MFIDSAWESHWKNEIKKGGGGGNSLTILLPIIIPECQNFKLYMITSNNITSCYKSCWVEKKSIIYMYIKVLNAERMFYKEHFKDQIKLLFCLENV